MNEATKRIINEIEEITDILGSLIKAAEAEQKKQENAEKCIAEVKERHSKERENILRKHINNVSYGKNPYVSHRADAMRYYMTADGGYLVKTNYKPKAKVQDISKKKELNPAADIGKYFRSRATGESCKLIWCDYSNYFVMFPSKVVGKTRIETGKTSEFFKEFRD